MQIFPTIQLLEEEENYILTVFSSPIVKKYLRLLAAEASIDLLGSATLTESPEVLQRKHLITSGKLSVLETLIGIQNNV